MSVEIEGEVELPDGELRSFVERLVRFETTGGNERTAQEWLRERLAAAGFEVHEWEADAETLADHPSFPDDPAEIAAADRPNVAGVLEFGDPDAGPTVVLNGHVDVVPAERGSWSSDPFEPVWHAGEDGDRLTARGAVDMKSGLAACVFAARGLRDLVDRGASGDRDGDATGDAATVVPEDAVDTSDGAGDADPRDADDLADLNGRVVVESVVGEEEGGIGAAAAALSNPYPFERDAALVAEPTELRAVTAVEGCVMTRLVLRGRSAHAATRWRGESVLPRFDRVREALRELERERAERVTHPLYEGYDNPWPVTVGTVEAGSWASNVPAWLEAGLRLGVAPGETVAEVERAYEERLAAVAADDEWLAEHPPSFERFSVQFEPAEVDPDEPVVRALQGAMRAAGLPETAPTGATYGADSRHYVAAGVPTVVFGPGSIEQAHFPDETVPWEEVRTATRVIAGTVGRLLG